MKDNLLYSALKEVMEGYSDLIKTLKNSSMPIDGGYLNYLESKHLTGKQALTHYDTMQGEDKVAGHPNNKQWPTVTDNDFRKMYRSLEVAVESLKHHEFYNRDLIYVLELTLNENKHFKI